MTFRDALIEFEYSVAINDEEQIVLTCDNIIIKFFHKIKTIYGCVVPKRPMDSIEDFSHNYTLFRRMREELKIFADITGYEISK